jgi:hypothetical protein
MICLAILSRFWRDRDKGAKEEANNCERAAREKELGLVRKRGEKEEKERQRESGCPC